MQRASLPSVSLSYHPHCTFTPQPILMSTPRGYTTFPSSADLFYFCTTSSTSEEDLNLHYAPPSKSSLRVGVLIVGHDQVQLLDLAVVDMLGNIGRNRMSRLNASTTTVENAVDEIDIRYVSESGLLGVTNLNSSDTEEAAFLRRLGDLLADATQPSFKGSCIAGCFSAASRAATGISV